MTLEELRQALEETAKQAPDAFKIFQLYVRGDDKFVDDIYERSQKAGFMPVRLGPRVLRTETAAVVALTVLQALWGDLR